MARSPSRSSSSSETRVPVSGSNDQDPTLPDREDVEKGRSVQEAGDFPEDPGVEEKVETEELKDPFCVQWEEGEMANPWNWGKGRKWVLTILASLVCFIATFASSLPSGASLEMQEYFHQDGVVITLTTSLFVLGYCFGNMIWAPLSEVYGRRPVLLGSYLSYMILIIPCGVAKNIETLLISRFLGGIFVTSSMTNSGGTIGDLWSPGERGTPFGVFSICPILAPLIAPICSGFLASAYSNSPNDGFRPVFWLLLVFSFTVFVAVIFYLPETYHPHLLQSKAKRLRKETGDERYWARLEREDHSFKAMTQKVLMRPILMLFTEPIVFLLSLYLALVYGIIYLFFELYPAIFIGIHGMTPGVGSLPFLAVALGSCIGYAVFPWYERMYGKAFVANENASVPEERLPPLFFAGPFLVVSLFWLGWSSDKHWIIPTLSGLFSGYAIFYTFQSVLTYLVDAYALYAASALAAAQMLRSLFGFAFPLFATAMTDRLGVPWTGSLLGFLAALLSPVPWIFYKYGVRIRKLSKFSVDH